ncbi:aspartate-semialdehyde dehydrogenase [Alphaproteobacteria bacterium]|jgi:aspartate-semialdehyde dehydrogenase|nr:aspartate-semialdehyde dehydrogenase [Alphaproteobacteria bacterium]MDC1115586.1 aspartate-semialdehyde dehydrogenase [Alphaproteobacteria bacterium]
MSYNVAIVGATGAVGREMIKTLAEREFPVDKVFALASKNSVGKEISYGEDEILTVQSVDKFDFANADIALFSAGSELAKQLGPKAGAAGCVVIDNSSAFRMDEDVPLIVPEVNGHVLESYFKDQDRRNIIANPNCSTAQLVVALKPLHEAYGIKRVVVSTYQAVSGAGSPAMDELFEQTRGVYVNDFKKPQNFTKEIAFNVIPHIDMFMDDGFTKEEWKMEVETKKILDPAIEVVAHCVRVPVFIGHSEAVFIECEKPLDEDAARDILREAEGVAVIDHRVDEGYVTPKEAAGEDAVYISRLRRDKTVDHGLVFWCVSDNLRKGAALNSVQIAEECVRRGL